MVLSDITNAVNGRQSMKLDASALSEKLHTKALQQENLLLRAEIEELRAAAEPRTPGGRGQLPGAPCSATPRTTTPRQVTRAPEPPKVAPRTPRVARQASAPSLRDAGDAPRGALRRTQSAKALPRPASWGPVKAAAKVSETRSQGKRVVAPKAASGTRAAWANALWEQRRRTESAFEQLASSKQRLKERQQTKEEVLRRAMGLQRELLEATEGHPDRIQSLRESAEGAAEGLQVAQDALLQEEQETETLRKKVLQEEEALQELQGRLQEVEAQSLRERQLRSNQMQREEALRSAVEAARADQEARTALLAESGVLLQKLNNEVLSLKGNIRVFCRLRPRLEQENQEKVCLELAEQQLTVYGVPQRNVTGLSEQTRCFQGERQLQRDRKVTIRILCQIGNVLEGRSSYQSRRNGRKMLSLQEMTQVEAEMWNMPAVQKGQRFLDNQEWEDRILQAVNFVGAGGPTRLQEFLLDLAAQEREEYYLDQYGKISEKPDMVLLEVEVLKAERQGGHGQLREEEAQQVDLAEADINEYEKVAGRDVLMIAMQREEEEMDDDQSALFAHRPDSLNLDEEVFHDLKTGRANLAFAAAAYLRILHALLVLPPDPSCRQQILRELRQPERLAKLIALISGLPALSCHVAAKFLRVMSHALAIGADDGDLPPATLEHFSMVAMFIQRLAESLLFLLKLTKDQRLDHKEEVLSVEIARFVGSMAQTAPRLSRVSNRFDQPDLQRIYIEKLLDWLVPSAALRIFVAMILYELQLDSGAASKAIHHEFVRDAYKRVGMKEQALSALSQILIRCSAYRYDVLEVFSVGEVFLAQNVRPSFLGELLMNLNLGSFTLFVEKFIADYDLLTKEQNVLFMETVRVQSKQGFNICLFVVTNRKVFLLEPSRNKPTFAAEGETFECWDASWEAMFPREPTVVWERDFSSLVRIWLGYGSQILAVEWQGRGKGQDLVSSPSDNKLQSEVYLFHRPDRCAILAETLRAAAAQGEAGMAVPILRDPAFRNLVLAQIQEEQVLATTVAVHGPQPRQGLFTSEQKADPTPRLFVLSAASVLEFEIKSSAWAPIKELDPAIFDDFTPADLEEAAEEEEEDLLPAPSEEDMALRHLLRLCGSQLPVPEGAPDGTSRPVLSLVKKYALPPSEITCETRNEADLSLQFSSGALCIRFFTDSSREIWRRGLAYALVKSEKGWSRHH